MKIGGRAINYIIFINVEPIIYIMRSKKIGDALEYE